jgi:predicted nucleic acid-binding protein
VILVDTSVWVDHLRVGVPALAEQLEARQVAVHAWIVGELACGNLRNRHEVLALLQNLPTAIMAADQEVLLTIERHSLMGRGIGYVDAALISSCLLSGLQLWTRDRRLDSVAQTCGVGYVPADSASAPP